MIHLPFLTQLVRLPLVTYPSLCSINVTYRVLYHVSGHLMLLTQTFPREAEDFLRGSNHCKHVPLLIYLAWLQPIINNLRLIFTHVKTKDVLLVVKILIKKYEVVAILITSHESASYLKELLLQKIHFRTVTLRCTSRLLHQKIHFKTSISKINFKNAPSKNAFHNCYLRSIVIKKANPKLAIF